ncbi:enoyl-CoA hydratase/isomerase family protein [Streptomyces sp. 8L]|uniref:enoyl-CoA hydratase/isomerase family protein n=1 Tax=Streptomyces sp. 8L TaxID=2877242 RepID=UPI001CD66FFD|nr:enoyl-CoA hydratase/isomerase family protein [Streptomyces sp. 8L]MCA1223612.1 enoyl-CoA hydratase/isomerase family protein [Streptomyces sp. 8L]
MPRKMLRNTNGAPYVSHISLEEYADWYQDFAVITREEGICVIRLHTNDGSAIISPGMHKAIPQILKYAGMDPDNEVIILTGTGDDLFAAMDAEALKTVAQSLAEDPLKLSDQLVELWPDALALANAVVFDVDVPTIGIMNGPTHTGLTQVFTYCDLTLMADDAYLYDSHFNRNLAPGDGLFQSLQKFIGDKRANYYGYTGANIDAKKALEWGMVNEVLPREELLPRALEIAQGMMKNERHVRRMTHALMRQRVARHLVEDLHFHVLSEGWGGTLSAINAAQRLKDGHTGPSTFVDDRLRESVEKSDQRKQ